MTLIVEDGSIVAGAESYISVANADTYHSNRGNTAWTGTTAAKEAALRKSTDYMTQIYRQRWQGGRVDADQVLDWPRYRVIVDGFSVDYDAVPDAVQNACAEFALRALSADLLADQTQGVLSKTVGPLSVDYDRTSPQAKRFPAVEAMIAPYLSGFGGVNLQVLRR